MKAVIIGAGIGGLSAALALLKYGWDVEILEQSKELNEIGAGIQISPNGVKVLRALNIDKTLEDYISVPRYWQFRGGYSGRVITNTPMGTEMEKRYGAPYWHIHRADFIHALAQALKEHGHNILKMNNMVVGYGQNDKEAWAQLSDGSRVNGDIIIGADGIKSIIRENMLGPSKAIFTGNVAWRYTVPVSDLGRHKPPPGACIWVGEGKHAVTYLLRGGTLANLVAVVERDWQVESWNEQGKREEALHDFAGWHPTIRKIINQSDQHYRWALFDRAPLEKWSDGRVVLLGDACHPMLPFMAQGAVMAMEDAYVLARSLSQHSDIDKAFTDYFGKRYARTARVQKIARDNMQLFHQRSTGGKLINFAPLWLANRLMPNKFHEHNDWLYGHDVTMP